MKEYKVRLYFTEKESQLIKVKGLNLSEASKKVGQMIKDGEIHTEDGRHFQWNYNLALVRTFHVSEN